MKPPIERVLEINDALCAQLWERRNERLKRESEAKWARIMSLWGDEPTGEPITFGPRKGEG